MQTKTILLVEDEAIIALNEKRQLEDQGYRVVIARSGREAIAIAAEREDLDLILMDINLGAEPDGTLAAERILEKRQIPVVFLSSHAEPEIVSKTEKITSYGYVLKGSSITVLDASIKMAFKLFEANREIRRNAAFIRRHSQILETILESFPGAVFWKDRNLVYQGCNSAVSLDAGLCSPAEVVGKTDYDLYGKGEKADFFRINDLRVLESGRPIRHISEKYDRKEAGARQYETSKFPLLDAEGAVSGIFGVSIDITELKEAQQRLLVSNAMLRKILDSIPEFVAWKDRNLVFLGCNANFASFFGLPNAQSIVGKTDWDLPMEKEEIEKYYADDRAVLEGDAPRHHIIERNRDAWGREVWLDTTKVPLHDADGAVNGILVTFSDITERWEAELSLLESEQLYLSTLEASPDGIVVTSIQGAILMTSPKVSAAIGSPHEEFEGKNIADFVVPEQRGRVVEALARLAKGEDIPLGEYRVALADGSTLEVEVSASAVRDPSGEVGKLMFAIRDVSIRKQKEATIASLLEEKTLILREVHHRIKNNMGVIQSLLALQADAIGEGKATAILEDAAERVQSMMVLYDKLYQSQSFTELSVKDYLPALLEQVVGNFPAKTKVRIESEVGDFSLSSKELQPLGIIVNELATNAMKYAFDGRSEGRLRLSATLSGNRVTVAFSDDGVGLPETVSLENSPGFGLSLASALSSQLGGAIRVERSAGTCFVLEFERHPTNPGPR